MKQTKQILYSLLMAIVMIAMSPMRAWAQEADPRMAVFNKLEGVTATFEDEGDYPWGLTRYIGFDALMNTNQGKDGTTTSKTTIKLACDQTIRLHFRYKTASEAPGDYLIISVDGNEVVNSQYAEPDEDGIATVVGTYSSLLHANANGHTITMSYIKNDNSSSVDNDYGFIYLIQAYTHQHYYNATSCDWSEDNTSATLHLECECGETADVEATTITRTEEAPTCEKDGFCTITASAAYNGKTVTDSKTETFAALGHDWQVQSDGTYACQREGCTAQSATFPIEVIESSGGFDGEGPEKLFDGDPKTKWCGRDVGNGSNSFYVIFKTGKPSVLVSYSLVDAEDTQEYHNRSWHSWEIQGSNDPNLEAWESISNENGGDYQGRTFTTGNTTAYTYYMITFSVDDYEGEYGEYYLQQMADMNITWCTEHQWGEDHKCSVCGYECQHSWDDGKCTVCGYWPGHTEHQWDMDGAEHRCTIPGCEEHGGWEEHTTEEGSCACTVCGHIEHQYENGVCENCGAECDHKNHWYEEARDATCNKDGNKGYYVCVCGLFFADADCTKKITWEDIYLPATGHQFDEQHHCTVCHRSITIGSTITLGEAADVNFINYCGRYNEEDPTAEPLYKIELTKAAYNFSISEELESPSIAIFDKDFNYILTVHVNEPNSLEAGTYYLLPSAYSEDEDEGGYVEFACTNVPLTITRIESITLNPEEVTDVNGDEVVLTLTDNGYATNQTIALDDDMEFYSEVEFTVPAVSYTRDISAYTGNNWGTLCLPFDYTVADATSAGLSIYEFTAASAEAVTVTHKTEGTVKYGTPVLFKKTGEGDGAALSLTATRTKMGFDQGVIDDISGLQLCGTFEPTPVNSGYYLDATDGMLYSIEEYCSEKSKESLTIPAYRAWFEGSVSNGNEAKAFNIIIDDEEMTAIDALNAFIQGKADIYGLDGQKRSDLQKGINIVNGKKILVK